MGWSYTKGASKADMIRELNEDRRTETGEVFSRVLASCVRGSTLWQLWETTTGEEPKRWINCAMLSKLPDYGWGAKEVDECMGPADVSCPLSYIERASVDVQGFAADWRERVRAHHAQADRVRALAYGDRIKLEKSLSFGRVGSENRFRVTDTTGRYFTAYALTLGMAVRIHKETLQTVTWEKEPAPNDLSA